ncbi:MAG: Abi-alpha family protein [Cyclobacteriaceae bacterium]
MEDETEKDSSTAIAIATEKAISFIEKVVANPLIEATGVLTDKVKFWRFQNQVKIILRAKEFLLNKGIKVPKKVPIKDLTTLLEYASLEDEEEMQDNWAHLLGEAMNPTNSFNTSMMLSQILSQISLNEIKILSYLSESSFIITESDRTYHNKHVLIQASNTTYTIGQLLIENLERLRLIEGEPPKLKDQYTGMYISDDGENDINEIIVGDSYRLSHLGSELMKKIKS